MKKLTKEEMIKAVQKAREKWPESFIGEYTGRPKFTPQETETLRQELRKADQFRARCLNRAPRTPKKGANCYA